jgi:phosphate starvation-inducible membrane PsiE
MKTKPMKNFLITPHTRWHFTAHQRSSCCLIFSLRILLFPISLAVAKTQTEKSDALVGRV